MNILKTSALASILALGSFAANASFTGSDTLEVQVNTGSAIIVDFVDEQMTFDDIVASDTIDAQTTVGITVSGTRAITCTFTEAAGTTANNSHAMAVNGNTNSTGITATTGIEVILYNQEDAANGGYLNVKLSQCTNASNIVVEIDSTDGAGASATLASTLADNAIYKTNVITLAVAYDTSTAITSFS
ncbi:MAG: hypothetical protein ISQ32_03125 [Rickettsiales bacterium]|nr:hypothetical protein [Rickettsiales bacterium]